MAATLALFVSQVKLKAFTAIQENTTPEKLVPFVIQAQDIYLQNILGSHFYNILKEQIIQNTVTQTNQELIDEFIANYVLNAALFQYLPFSRTPIYNRGPVSTSDGEGYRGSDLQDLKYIREVVSNTMEFYGQRLRMQLVLNSGQLYPDWLQSNFNNNMNPDASGRYTTGFALPKYASRVKNQSYGRTDTIVGGQGWYDGTGCDNCYEKYGPSAP
jgi:hypothetical protein